MSLPESTKVLIVGAGPVGLATALSLLHHNFHDFVIVDAVQEGENTSRAIIVHAATLEALDTLGCGDDIVSQGTKATSLFMGSRSQTLISPCMDYLDRFTRHPYALIVPQCLTEHALGKKFASLGGVIHRPMNVVGVKRNEKEPGWMDVMFEDGRVVRAAYVVGADGARSVVRTSAGIDFKDPMDAPKEQSTNLAQMILADVTFEGPMASFADIPFSGTMSSESFFLFVALPPTCNEYLANTGELSTSEQLFRIGCGVPLQEGDIPHPSKEYLQNCVDRFGPYRLSSDPAVNPSGKPVSIKDVVWSTRFRNYAAIADRMFTRLESVSRDEEGESGERVSEPESELESKGGVILLVGDAAHIHSPAGGQGMNLGLRDAVFLGEALTKHIEVSSTKSVSEADAILREFAESRHARALEVIAFTKRILWIAGMKYREKMYWWLPMSSATVRDWALWIAGSIPFVRRRMAWELSGLGRK